MIARPDPDFFFGVVLILLLISNAMSNLRLATSMPTTQAVSFSARTFLVCRLWLRGSGPKLPFGLIEREMNRSTYLTHRFMHLLSCRCLAVQPAQHYYCSAFRRQRQYTRPYILHASPIKIKRLRLLICT